MINRVYHALSERPLGTFLGTEQRTGVYNFLPWDTDYCKFSPGYSYTEEEIGEIQAGNADQAWQEVSLMAAETSRFI